MPSDGDMDISDGSRTAALPSLVLETPTSSRSRTRGRWQLSHKASSDLIQILRLLPGLDDL